MARGREDYEKNTGLLKMLKLLQILSFLIVFVMGVVIGLATRAHMNRYFGSQTENYSLINHLSANKPHEEKNCTIVPVSDKVDCMSMETILQPKNLKHSLSDDELFWRASMVPRKREFPFERVPKVAFMFLTRGPLPLLPLWERFFQGHDKYFSIYVHVIPGYKLNVSTTSPFYLRQIPSQPVSWGTLTLLDAERRLLANALLDLSNERFVLLSESCIPIHNFTTVYEYLVGSNHSYVESYDDPGRYGRGRYRRNMFPDIKLHQWRKGSQWFELSRALSVYIVSETKYYAIFSNYCLPPCYPDEHYLPTYINMLQGSLNSNRTVTWVDWSLRGPHPTTYEGDNITEDFLRWIRNNGAPCQYNAEMKSICYLFARKFAPTALEPLLKLAAAVMEY